MRLRIILLVIAISSQILVSFLVPLALLLRTSAADQAKSSATIQTQWMVPLVATLDEPSLRLAVARVNAQNKSQPVTVFMPDGQTLGPSPQRSPAVQLAAHGRSFAANVRGGVEVLMAVQGLPQGTAVIRTFVPDSRLTRGVLHIWIVLGGIGLGLLGLSVIVSALLARSLVRPLRTLAHASEALAAGDLSARAPIEGAPEIRQVSTGLNRLAVRIGELLAHERETVADLSHRLRTPLTALRIDAESLRDDEEMARVINDVDGLTRTVNEIIREARRPTDGGGTACDAGDVVRGRAAFWRALAEDQERQMMVEVAPAGLPVRASARDVAACVDILLENVFAHTPEGAALAIRVSSRAGGGAWLVVTDEGPGFSDPDPTLRGNSSGGSTGLGLDIARRIAENSGGTLMLGHSRQGGGAVTVGLGSAVSPGKQERHIRQRRHLLTRRRRAEDARLAAELAVWAAIAGPDLNTR
jgi:signal transduction histidine kinase